MIVHAFAIVVVRAGKPDHRVEVTTRDIAAAVIGALVADHVTRSRGTATAVTEKTTVTRDPLSGTAPALERFATEFRVDLG